MSTAITRGMDDYHGDGRLDWRAVKAAGIEFAIHKATQGISMTDPAFAYNWVASQTAGLLRGAYHFFDPAADPVAQARHFCQCVPYKKGDLRLALDVEVDAPDIAARTEACIAEIKRITGLYPFLYASRSFYEDRLSRITSCPLWIAEYGVNAPRISCPLWQDSESGRVEGVTHALDLDTYFGSIEELRAQHTFARSVPVD
ncbi:MAG: glycoside hydrolase family 25 protein [Capsulimonadaceae bacterium]